MGRRGRREACGCGLWGWWFGGLVVWWFGDDHDFDWGAEL